jgi:hypothetical protein
LARQGVELEVVANAAHGQAEPAAGRVIDDDDRLIVEHLGQPRQPVRPGYGIAELGRGFADLGKKGGGVAELPAAPSP